MTTIHEATKEDIPYMVAAGKRMFEESRFRKFSFDTDKATKLGDQTIGTDFCVAYVARNDEDQPIGFIMGLIYPHIWGDHKQSIDVAFYVDKEHRYGGAGVLLAKAYVDETKRRGIDDILIGVSSSINNEASKHVMEKIGFQSIGFVMAYGVE